MIRRRLPVLNGIASDLGFETVRFDPMEMGERKLDGTHDTDIGAPVQNSSSSIATEMTVGVLAVSEPNSVFHSTRFVRDVSRISTATQVSCLASLKKVGTGVQEMARQISNLIESIFF